MAAALALATSGRAITILEKQPVAREDGAGIQIGPNGCQALRHLGLLDHVASVASKPDAIVISDGATGRVLTRLPLGAAIEHRFNAPYLTLARPDLQSVLLDAVTGHPSITLRRDHEVVGITEHLNAVTARTSNGSEETANGIIVADGLWSTLRSVVTGPITPRATGKVAFRTLIEGHTTSDAGAANCVNLWLSRDAHVVTYPVRAGQATAVVVVIADPAIEDGWNAPPDLIRLDIALKALNAKLARFLALARNSWRMWSLQTVPTPKRISKGRVALLGDAAHPVLPFLAQGAVMALEDACVLAECFDSKQGDIRTAFAAYDRVRLRRKAKVAQASTFNGQLYHLPGVAALARNTALRMLPPETLLSRYDWLYGWTPRS